MPWPTHWANWILLPLVMVGILRFEKSQCKHSEKSKIENRKSKMKWLWLLPLLWFGWQLFSATQTMDANLTAATLWQFFGCVACYFLGAFLFGIARAQLYLLPACWPRSLFASCAPLTSGSLNFRKTTRCWLKATQRLDEFPAGNPRLEMKQENVIVTTNGVDVANPVILKKFQKAASTARWFIRTRSREWFCCCFQFHSCWRLQRRKNWAADPLRASSR